MPKSKKSWVWNYLIDNGKTATCQFCKKEYKSGQGTSTLMYHFNQVHPEKILPTPSKHRRSESTDDSEPPKKKPNIGVQSTFQSEYTNTYTCDSYKGHFKSFKKRYISVTV